MAITISGIRVESITAVRDKEDGGYKCESSYVLLSSADKVVARQSSGGYNESIKVTPSPSTKKAFDEFIRLYVADISELIGLDVE